MFMSRLEQVGADQNPLIGCQQRCRQNRFSTVMAGDKIDEIDRLSFHPLWVSPCFVRLEVGLRSAFAINFCYKFRDRKRFVRAVQKIGASQNALPKLTDRNSPKG